MKNYRDITLPASTAVSGYIGFYNARKTLPLRRASESQTPSGCSCDFTEKITDISQKISEINGFLAEVSVDFHQKETLPDIDSLNSRIEEIDGTTQSVVNNVEALSTMLRDIANAITIVKPSEDDEQYSPAPMPGEDVPPPEYYDIRALYEDYNNIKSILNDLQNKYDELSSKYKETKDKELSSWDPFALSDATDNRGALPHIREFLSGYLIDLSSDFTPNDMHNSFYGIKGMLDACYFVYYGLNGYIPYDTEVTSTYEVSAYILTSITVDDSGDYGIYFYNNNSIGDIEEVTPKMIENWDGFGRENHGISGKMWSDGPMWQSQCWTYLSSRTVEETSSIGPNFNNLRATFNFIVSSFIATQENFADLFEANGVRLLTSEAEATMDSLQAAMNNLIYTLLGTYNSHTDVLYQTLSNVANSLNPNNGGEYSLDSVAAAVRDIISFLQTK